MATSTLWWVLGVVVLWFVVGLVIALVVARVLAHVDEPERRRLPEPDEDPDVPAPRGGGHDEAAHPRSRGQAPTDR